MTYTIFIRKYGMTDSKAVYREYLERYDVVFAGYCEAMKNQHVEQTYRLRFINNAWM